MLFVSCYKFFSSLRFLNFCLSFFGHVGNWLDKQAKVNYETYDVAGRKTIKLHILPNISRSKVILIMKFGQLIEYNMKIIFLEKSYTKCGEETSPRPFSKQSKLSISLN